jgi:hypothetical protein
MKMLKALSTGLAVIGLLSVTSARASLVSVGSPIPGNSWAQGFYDSTGANNFDNIAVTWVSGTVFEPPALRDFLLSDYITPAVGWSAPNGNSTSDTASGNALNYLVFNMNWINTQADPTTFDFYAYNGNVLVDSAQASWTGGANGEWDITSIPVPEPTTMIAGALLLLPLGASTLRILRRNRIG